MTTVVGVMIVIGLGLLTWLAVDVLEGELGDVHLLLRDEYLSTLIAGLQAHTALVELDFAGGLG